MSPPGINLHSVIQLYTLAYMRVIHTSVHVRSYAHIRTIYTAGPQFYMLLHTISLRLHIIRTNRN